MPQMQKWTCLRGSEWTPFVDVFFMHQRVETRQLNQRYLTAIRTYFTRWLIRTNCTTSLVRFCTICLNPSDG